MRMVRYKSTTGEKVEYDDDRPDPIARYLCPCCRYKTLTDRGGFEICPVCFWEDDGQNDHNADEVLGGPNGSLSLTEARRNFLSLGACEGSMVEYVRPPNRIERGEQY